MHSQPNVFAVLSTVVFMFIITAACQSTTEKTVDQTISDASISTAVQAKLTSERVSHFLHVNVTTERGIVTLSGGTVATKTERGQAERLARQVKGVLKTILQIKSRPTAAGKPVPRNHLPDTKGDPPLQGVRTIQGEVVRLDGENYIVKSDDGREVQLQADMMTRRLETIQSGDRIEADVDDDNHAVLLLLSQRPNTLRR